jgi:hypothetical protein
MLMVLEGHGMRYNLKPIGQRTIALYIDMIITLVTNVENGFGVAVVLTAIVHFQFNSEVNAIAVE